jgi:hypothetical protein
LPEKAEGFTIRPSAAFPSPFVIAVYSQILLIPQDSGALHLDIFEQPLKHDSFVEMKKISFG